MPKSKAKPQVDLIAKLFRFHPSLVEKVEAKITKDKEMLRAKRCGNMTALTANLLDAWAEGRIDLWKQQ